MPNSQPITRLKWGHCRLPRCMRSPFIISWAQARPKESPSWPVDEPAIINVYYLMSLCCSIICYSAIANWYILVPLLPSLLILGKSLHLSKSPFLHLQNSGGDDNDDDKANPPRSLWRLSKRMHSRLTAQCLAYSEYSMYIDFFLPKVML